MATPDELPPCYSTDTWEGVTLDEFMGCNSNMALNRQSRMLADLRLVNCYNTTGISKRERDESILASAKANLEKMSFFGLTARQKDSQILFERTLGLKFNVDFQDDADLAGTYEEDIDDVTMGKIKELNHLDIQLFEFAERLMNQRLDLLRTLPSLYESHNEIRSGLPQHRRQHVKVAADNLEDVDEEDDDEVEEEVEQEIDRKQ